MKKPMERLLLCGSITIIIVNLVIVLLGLLGLFTWLFHLY